MSQDALAWLALYDEWRHTYLIAPRALIVALLNAYAYADNITTATENGRKEDEAWQEMEGKEGKAEGVNASSRCAAGGEANLERERDETRERVWQNTREIERQWEKPAMDTILCFGFRLGLKYRGLGMDGK
ncbi:hypothetical protein B0H34DRAFT_671483 [Crassisporium funariophilum]|nr:hypothetical protein B0H34DRAFT_671483 [Crassisporium funariophilum]